MNDAEFDRMLSKEPLTEGGRWVRDLLGDSVYRSRLREAMERFCIEQEARHIYIKAQWDKA